MDCPQCGHHNQDGAKFCNECGAPLVMACGTCATVNPPRSKFCHECGTALTGPVSSAKFQVPSPPQPPASRTLNSELRTSQSPSAYTPTHLAERIRAVNVTDGERKTITALFADLKGSTALIEGIDPEEERAVIDPALQLMMDAVHQYDGYVAQALGDGIFALFGAPLAHEDAPNT